MRFTHVLMTTAVLCAGAVQAQQCDLLSAVQAVANIEQCTAALPDTKEDACACISEAREAITNANCGTSEVMALFNLIDDNVCKTDVQCDAAATVQCVINEYAGFLASGRTSCDQYKQTVSCVRNTCSGAIPSEAEPLIAQAEEFICADRDCDLMREAACVVDVVNDIDSFRNIGQSDMNNACECADTVFECAMKPVSGYSFDSNIVFGVVQQVQQICNAECNTANAAQCVDAVTVCRDQASTEGDCQVCTTTAESCLAATLCTTDAANEQITELSNLQCANVGSNNNNNNNSNASGAASLIANLMGMATMTIAAVLAL